MSLDSDVAILGTGVAPLIAAKRLTEEGKSVLLLNPDWDFFQEDSELPLDPFWPVEGSSLKSALSVPRVERGGMDAVLSELRPEFPGSIEIWPRKDPEGYRDPFAPHVRSRSRIWMSALGEPSWEAMEALYVESSDAGLNPMILEGITAAKKFPGLSGNVAGSEVESLRALMIPRMADVDVTRFRNGVLEFVRERLDATRMITAASQVELMPEGLRFYSQGEPRTARIRDGLLAFWTPRLSPWVMAQGKRFEVKPPSPLGVRLWEQWTLLSRESLSPAILGTFEGLSVWAETEGDPEASGHGNFLLSVLKAGPLLGLEEIVRSGMPWGSTESFGLLSKLCAEFLKWDKISVRSMKPRALFEFAPGEGSKPWALPTEGFKSLVISSCDGPLVEVVQRAREACKWISA